MILFGMRVHRKHVFVITILCTFFFTLASLIRKISSLHAFGELPYMHHDDVKKFLVAGKETGVKIILFDSLLLESWEKNSHLRSSDHCVFLCHSVGSLSFAIYNTDLRNLSKFLQRVSWFGFSFEQFFSPDGHASHLFFLRYGSPLHLIVLHWINEAGYWRQFSLSSQSPSLARLKEFITVDHWNIMSVDRAFEKFSIKEVSMDGGQLYIPSNIKEFVKDFGSSRFIACNEERARYFEARFPEIRSPETIQFEHSAWKLLAKAKTILDQMNIPFWISSGTCLGFFRQCKFIPWSMDVDIGIFIEDYKSSLIPAFESKDMKLVHQFGKLEDSFELSFMENTLKLDIFFFYAEGAFIWNGGTQVKSGKKFKYVFPPFTLCWTEFLELKIRIPCQTESYIKANYGDNWFTPIKYWDWKTSPNNVKENGRWTQDEREKHVIIKSLPT